MNEPREREALTETAAGVADGGPGGGPGHPDQVRLARRAIEAVVMAAIQPVEARVLAELLEISVADVEAHCDELAAEYAADDRGFALARVAGGFRFETHPDLAPYVEHFVLEGQTARLSTPALETLSIVAYKQPITRGHISAIRGVNVESTLATLVQRGYVEEVGRDLGPGGAVLYGTTTQFLERLGLDELSDLPPLGDFVPAPELVEALERGLLGGERSLFEEGAVADGAVADVVEDATDAVGDPDAGGGTPRA